MYPNWVIEIFADNRCIQCQSLIGIDAIEVIGLQSPTVAELYSPMPLGLVVAKCPHCHEYIHFTMRMDRQSIQEAIDELARVIAIKSEESTGTLFALPKKSTKKPNRAPAPKQVRPSRRQDHPLDQPTDEERRAFIYVLRLTSFRRASKSFYDWMRRLGIDIAGPPTEGNDQG